MLVGEISSSFYRRPPTTTTTSSSSTASSVSANMGPTNTPTFSKALEGLEGVLVRIFTTIKNMQGAIDSYEKKLEASKASPYLIFHLVTTDDLLEMERGRERGEINRGVRMTHYVDWNILILKVPTVEHEAAHGNFRDGLVVRVAGMGLQREFLILVQQNPWLVVCLKRETQVISLRVYDHVRQIGQLLSSSPDGLNH
jgi:hypothetical protein